MRNMAFVALAQPLTNAAGFNTATIPISRIMMPTIRNTLLNEVAEFLQKVQFHTIL